MKIILLLILLFNIGAVFAVIFVEKKNPSSTLAWILILLLLPVIGFLLYFFVGSSRKIKLVSKKYKIDTGRKIVIDEMKKTVKYDHKDLESLFKLNYESYLNTVTNKNDVVLYSNMNEAINKVLRDLLNAKESININFFIFKSNSAIGEKIINILEKKAEEGLKIKFTYDRLGALGTRKKHFKKLEKLGVDIVHYLPSIIRTLLQVNYRSHRKMIIIDGEIAYTGGMNIGDEYLSLDKKIYPWRDTFARITGEAVPFINAVFMTDFMFYKKLKLKKKYSKKDVKNDLKNMFKVTKGKEDNKIQVVINGPDTYDSYIRDGYINIINNAKKYVYINTPYFIPDEALLEAIRLKVKTGVDVRMIIPGVPDKKFVYYVTYSFVEELIKYGVKVYQYKGFIHSKMIISDDEYLSFGTCNFDVRSFRLNYENQLFIKSKKLSMTAKKDFMNDIKKSRKVTLAILKDVSFYNKFLAMIYRLMSPIL